MANLERGASGKMVRALRAGLDGHWLLAWDQEVPGWSRAVTIAVGPSGIWALWGA